MKTKTQGKLVWKIKRKSGKLTCVEDNLEVFKKIGESFQVICKLFILSVMYWHLPKLINETN